MDKNHHMYTARHAISHNKNRKFQCDKALNAFFLFALLFSGAFAADAPENFSSRQYSESAGELFWDRPARRVIGFELTRNNSNLGIFDALSYFDDTLEPDMPYIYTIAVVEMDGSRSPIATAELGPRSATSITPSGFRASVYSQTTVELFWDRAREPGIQFEIIIDNGTSIITGGGSLLLNDLEPDTNYQASIRAINTSSGATSPYQQTSFRSNGENSPQRQRPATPIILRQLIYSAVAAEFFWDQNSNTEVEYEISLNGELLNDGQLQREPSVYLDTLVPDSRNTISIVAVDGQNSRSEPAELTFDMPPADAGERIPPTQAETDGSPVSVSNVNNILSNVFSIIENHGHQEVMGDLANFRFTEPDNPVPGLALISDDSFVISDTQLYRRVYDCTEGGAFIHEPLMNESGDATLVFDDCAIAGTVRDGTVFIRGFEGNSTSYNYDNYTQVKIQTSAVDNTTIELIGEAGSDGTRVSDQFSEFSVLDYALTTRAGEQRVSILQQSFEFDSNLSSPNTFSTNFEVEGFWTQGRKLRVETIDLFQTTDINSNYYELGMFRISDTTTPANYIEFSAETGELDTYQLTVVVGESITTEVLRWDELP
ncbi:MAG: hypothetical protein AB8B97_07445 [Granulosicoccus sp.]